MRCGAVRSGRLRNRRRLVDCRDTARRLAARARTRRRNLGLFNGSDRSRVAVVVTTDGRRVHLPMTETGLVDVSLLALLRSLLLGLDGLLGLITGSRRENGGSRR